MNKLVFQYPLNRVIEKTKKHQMMQQIHDRQPKRVSFCIQTLHIVRLDELKYAVLDLHWLLTLGHVMLMSVIVIVKLDSRSCDADHH